MARPQQRVVRTSTLSTATYISSAPLPVLIRAARLPRLSALALGPVVVLHRGHVEPWVGQQVPHHPLVQQVAMPPVIAPLLRLTPVNLALRSAEQVDEQPEHRGQVPLRNRYYQVIKPEDRVLAPA